MKLGLKRKLVAIVPAAGESRRFGADRPKLFSKLGGLSVMERTLTALLEFDLLSLIVAINPKFRSQYVACMPQDERIRLVDGGETRAKSVLNCLEYLQGHYSSTKDMTVLVHDAARCLVSKDLICAAIDAANEFGAATAAYPITDAVCRAESHLGTWQESVERKNLFAVQTPQVFEFDILYKAHTEVAQEPVDDAGLVAKIRPVQLVSGERTNIKITYFEDLKFAEALLQLNT